MNDRAIRPGQTIARAVRPGQSTEAIYSSAGCNDDDPEVEAELIREKERRIIIHAKAYEDYLSRLFAMPTAAPKSIIKPGAVLTELIETMQSEPSKWWTTGELSQLLGKRPASVADALRQGVRYGVIVVNEAVAPMQWKWSGQ